MARQKENGLVLEEKNGTIYIVLKLTVRRQLLWTLLILLTSALITLGSSLNEDVRKIILDFLIGVLQLTIFTAWRPKP